MLAERLIVLIVVLILLFSVMGLDVVHKRREYLLEQGRDEQTHPGDQ